MKIQQQKFEVTRDGLTIAIVSHGFAPADDEKALAAVADFLA